MGRYSELTQASGDVPLDFRLAKQPSRKPVRRYPDRGGRRLASRRLRGLLLSRPTLPLCRCDPGTSFGAQRPFLPRFPAPPHVTIPASQQCASFLKTGDLGVDRRQQFRCVYAISLIGKARCDGWGNLPRNRLKQYGTLAQSRCRFSFGSPLHRAAPDSQ